MIDVLKPFRTNLKKKSVNDIGVGELRNLGIKAVAIDADNTTSYDRTTNPLPGAENWIRSIKDARFDVILLSNAKESRAKVLSDQYDIPVVGMACKPLPFGYIRAAIKLRTLPQNICMIGDQLFTDIIGANLCGYKSIYVSPFAKETKNAIPFAIKRFGERVIFSILEREQRR